MFFSARNADVMWECIGVVWVRNYMYSLVGNSARVRNLLFFTDFTIDTIFCTEKRKKIHIY